MDCAGDTSNARSRGGPRGHARGTAREGALGGSSEVEGLGLLEEMGKVGFFFYFLFFSYFQFEFLIK
jgi:hypothetical protein